MTSSAKLLARGDALEPFAAVDQRGADEAAARTLDGVAKLPTPACIPLDQATTRFEGTISTSAQRAPVPPPRRPFQHVAGTGASQRHCTGVYASPMTFSCLICESATEAVGSQRVLGRHDAHYRRCKACGYLFIVDPHWLAEAYATAIAALDTGIVTRNLWLADATTALLGSSLRAVRRSVDFGGGTGLLVRLMRDRGHDFHWHDAYSPNLLAIGFEADLQQRYDLVTAFELIEHLTDPVATVAQLRQLAPVLLISTELLPDPMPALDRWWYFAPEAGQHIGFFTRRSLEVLGERFGLMLSSNGRNLHVLAPSRVSETLLRALRKPVSASLLAPLGKRRSLAHRDADLLQQRLQSAHEDHASS
jgi:hypothetical protein